MAVGLVVALAHPDRIARKRSGTSSYLMASGTGAALDPRDPGPLAGLEWLAVGDAERRPGQREARIRAAAPLTEDLALEAAGSLWTEVDEVDWSGWAGAGSPADAAGRDRARLGPAAAIHPRRP